MSTVVWQPFAEWVALLRPCLDSDATAAGAVTVHD